MKYWRTPLDVDDLKVPTLDEVTEMHGQLAQELTRLHGGAPANAATLQPARDQRAPGGG